MRPGIHHDLPLADYLGAPGINKTGLTLFARSPARYRFGIPQATRSQALGRLAHTLILEPDQVAHRFHVSKLPTFNDNHKAFQAEQREALGRELVKVADFDAALRIRDGVMANTVARSLLRGPGVTVEPSFWWIDPATGVLCRGRADATNQPSLVMVDVKTSRNARYNAFQRDAADFRYHWQHPMYVDGYTLAGQGTADSWTPVAFIFLVVETEPPHLTATFEYTREAVHVGRREVAATLRQFRECQAADRWPGYPEGIQDLDLPARFAREPINLTLPGNPR